MLRLVQNSIYPRVLTQLSDKHPSFSLVYFYLWSCTNFLLISTFDYAFWILPLEIPIVVYIVSSLIFSIPTTQLALNVRDKTQEFVYKTISYYAIGVYISLVFLLAIGYSIELCFIEPELDAC